MSYFNLEHYPDPTAAEAMDNVIQGPDRPPEPVDEGVRRLAEAVILSAAEDYARLLRCPWRSEALLREKRELEAFFRSEWFRLISGMNGAAVLRGIRKEVLRRDRA